MEHADHRISQIRQIFNKQYIGGCREDPRLFWFAFRTFTNLRGAFLQNFRYIKRVPVHSLIKDPNLFHSVKILLLEIKEKQHKVSYRKTKGNQRRISIESKFRKTGFHFSYTLCKVFQNWVLEGCC